MNMFFIAGIGVAVLIELLLISKKNRSVSDDILTIWMFLVLVQLFLFYTYISGDSYRFPFVLGIEQPLPLVNGVLWYFYVCSITKQCPSNKKLMVLHFIPIVVMYGYLVSFFLLPAGQKIQIYQNQGAGYELFNAIKSYAIACSGIIYVTWSAVLLRRHRDNIREQYSDLHRVNLQWLRLMTYGVGGIWFLVIFFGSDMLVYGGVVLFVFLIGFFGVRQTDIFVHGSPAESGGEQRKKYPKSGLTDEASDILHSKLLRLMTEEALYKKSDLSIGDLSSRLDVHPNYLSQIINQKEKKNFYDFVNMYRIDEFKRLIEIPKNRHLTLLSLAYDCGFNSKSSFNRYFKKATGQTPSEYFTALTAK